MIIKNLEAEILRANEVLIKLKEDIIKTIEALPQNDKIKPISESIYLINASDLGDNWSPSYHNFKTQYNAILSVISSKESALSILKSLKEMIEKGVVRQKKKMVNMGLYSFTETKEVLTEIKLHPEVIWHLEILLNKEV